MLDPSASRGISKLTFPANKLATRKEVAERMPAVLSRSQGLEMERK